MRGKIAPFTRRTSEDKSQCSCPLFGSACENQADGEDRLCDFCRHECQPDREAIQGESE